MSRPELAVLRTVQATVGAVPGAVTVARGMSHFGEHSLGWLGLSAVGAALDREHRGAWIGVGVAAFGSHAASVILKRIVRRPRPDDPSVAVNVATPSRLSFPSSHATSTTAAAVLAGRITGLPLPAVLVPPMLLSRMLLGVHYPSDVAAGAVLGAVSAELTDRLRKRYFPETTGTAPKQQ